MSTTSTSPPYPDRATGVFVSTRQAALIFTILTAALTWPQTAHLLSVPPHDDAYFSMWRLAWIAHQLPRDPVHLFDANTLYPAKNTLAYSDAVLFQGIVGAPLIWLGAPVVLVYNLHVLATFVLCGLGMFLLVRDLTGHPAAGLIAGIIFAFGPYRFDHYVHLELVSAQWMPFALWMLHRTLQSGRVADGLMTGAFGALQVLSCVYLAVFFATIVAGLAPLLFFSAPAALRRRAWRPLGAGALLTVTVLGLYMVPYRAARGIVGERGAGERMLYAAGPKHYLAAMPESIVYGRLTGSIGLHEKRLFTGFLAMLLGAAALWPPLDRRRLAYAIALALAVDISFGHRGIVGALLQDQVAAYRGLRVVARIGAIVLMLMAILAGYGAARLLRQVPGRSLARMAAVALGMVLVAEYAIWPMRLDAVDTRPTAVYRWLQEQPPGVVAEFPMPASWKKPFELGLHESRFSYNSTFTWYPVVNGYSGFWPPSYINLIQEVEGFPSDHAMRALGASGVDYLILHERFYGRDRYLALTHALGARTDVSSFGPFKEGSFEVRAYRLLSR